MRPPPPPPRRRPRYVPAEGVAAPRSVPATDPRARRRQPRNPSGPLVRHSVARAILPSFLVVIIPAALGFAVSDFFRLREVVVEAESVGLAEEVAAALEVPAGANTLFLSLHDLKTQAEAAPRVLTARVDRVNRHRILVRLEERDPAFALKAEGGFTLVDETGVLLFHTGKVPAGMPVVQGPGEQGWVTGGRLGPDALLVVLQCMEGAQEAGMGLEFSLDLQTRYDFRLRTPSGTPVKLGGPDNLVRKVILAAAIEEDLAGSGNLSYIDVRIPARPVYGSSGGQD